MWHGEPPLCFLGLLKRAADGEPAPGTAPRSRSVLVLTRHSRGVMLRRASSASRHRQTGDYASMPCAGRRNRTPRSAACQRPHAQPGRSPTDRTDDGGRRSTPTRISRSAPATPGSRWRSGREPAGVRHRIAFVKENRPVDQQNGVGQKGRHGRLAAKYMSGPRSVACSILPPRAHLVADSSIDSASSRMSKMAS